MALDVWNTLEVQTLGSGEPVVEISGEGAGELGTGRDNLVYRSMEFLFHEAGQDMPTVRIRCKNDIPLARGMGSSAAAIAGGLVAANAICSQDFTANELLEMAATIEGHPDNVAAAVMGGMQLVIMDQTDHGRQLYAVPVNVPPEMRAVVFVPDVRIATDDARAVLPEKVSIADAVHNLGRVGLLVASMATNHPEYLAIATQDRLHQRPRQAMFPAMGDLFEAATAAGADGVFLSGAGPTVLALTRHDPEPIGRAMAEAARSRGVDGFWKRVALGARGAHVAHEERS